KEQSDEASQTSDNDTKEEKKEGETEMVEDKKANTHLTAKEITELLDWEDIFAETPQLLSASKQNLCIHMEVLKTIFSVEEKDKFDRKCGLTHLEFLEMLGEYPMLLQPSYQSLLAKFRFVISCVGPVVLKRFCPDLSIASGDWKDFPNTNGFKMLYTCISTHTHSLFFFFCKLTFFYLNTYNTLEIGNIGRRQLIKKIARFGWCFSTWSWGRLSRLKYWQYFPGLHEKLDFFSIITLSPLYFLRYCDNQFFEFHYNLMKQQKHEQQLFQQGANQQKDTENKNEGDEDSNAKENPPFARKAIKRLQHAQLKRQHRQHVNQIEEDITNSLLMTSPNAPAVSTFSNDFASYLLSKKNTQYLDCFHFIQNEIQSEIKHTLGWKHFDKDRLADLLLVPDKKRLLNPERYEEWLKYKIKIKQQLTQDIAQWKTGDLQTTDKQDESKGKQHSKGMLWGSESITQQVEVLKELEKIHGRILMQMYMPTHDEVLTFLNTKRFDWQIKSSHQSVDDSSDPTQEHKSTNRPYELQF
ncbi:hypothetical protein RFI_28927, partial [Reticulomyxa filosa]